MDAIDWEIKQQKKDIEELNKQVDFFKNKGYVDWVYIDGMILQKKNYINHLKKLKK